MQTHLATNRVGDVQPALEAEGISKHFDGVSALDGAEFSVQPGEIHALLGENGAGKSTLIKVLTGVLQPDQGTIRRSGEQVKFTGVRSAQRAGIAALYQELSIIPNLSVEENILLGDKLPGVAGFVKWDELHRSAERELARLNQQIPIKQLAGTLSPVQQTMVAVARALAFDAQVLILDEPTASLTDREISDLFMILRKLRDEGVAIVYVSHRLEEVFELCDRMTVMRGGKTIVTKPISHTSMDEVISAMAGQPAGEIYPERRSNLGATALSVESLSGRRVRDISFAVASGEVIGIAGLAGSGRSELLRILAGAQRRASGQVTLGTTVLSAQIGVGKALDLGIALVPEERRTQGVVLNASIEENVAIVNLHSVSRWGWVSNRRIGDISNRAIDMLKIKATNRRQRVGELSGGNQQKIVLAKVLERSPRLLLLDEPTRGIDVQTKSEIYRLIRELAARGTAIIMISSELPELLGVTDRILVMHEGRISGEAIASQATEELLLNYSYGKVA